MKQTQRLKKKTIEYPIFDKLLVKNNYTKEEVKEILLGTYEGFSDKIIDILNKKDIAISEERKKFIKWVDDNVGVPLLITRAKIEFPIEENKE